ncbi:DUF982 domain-containing protein [Rhizobium leucaenae]|uniref:DUF982 domain-containing protein n=1 Tax=Rhizobium leucaenae TaxID=29450 RepID=UPI0013765D49
MRGDRRSDRLVHARSGRAIHYLCVQWPSARGASHARAKEKCFAAVSHRLTVEAAREAFVTACQDAHLIRDGAVSQ